MTLQEFVNKYNGKIVGDGQCGTLVRAYWNEVDHTTPPSYPNSKDYWFNPVPGYDKVHDPQPGNIAIYNGHGVYTEGHSAIYVDGRVFEQNADPDHSPAHLFPRANTYLLGYLRKQGADMEPTFNDGDRLNFNSFLYGQDLGLHGDQVGKHFKDAAYAILESSDYNFQHKVNDGDVVNIGNAGITNAASAKGFPWKDAVYNVILKNLPAGGAPSTVLKKGKYEVQ